MKPSPNQNQKFKAAVFDIRPQKGSLLLRSTESLNGNPWNDDEMQTIKEKLVKIKVFNRQVNFYDNQEVKVLKSWLDKEPQKTQNYFETHLLTASLQSPYESSNLAKVFQNAKHLSIYLINFVHQWNKSHKLGRQINCCAHLKR